MGKGCKKGMGKGKEKTDKDVCLKCGQRGQWAKNCPNPEKIAGGSGTMAESGRHRRSRAQLRVSGLRRPSRWPSHRQQWVDRGWRG